MDIYDKIAKDFYRNCMPYAALKVDPEVHDAYQKESARLDALFRQDALAHVGLTGHPKADKAFAFAWEHGHASGYNDVMYYLDGVADVIRD